MTTLLLKPPEAPGLRTWTYMAMSIGCSARCWWAFGNVSVLAYRCCYENKVNSIDPYQTWLCGSKQFDMLFAILQFYLTLYQRVRINHKRRWVCFPLHNVHKSSNWLASSLGSVSPTYSPSIWSRCCANAYSYTISNTTKMNVSCLEANLL